MTPAGIKAEREKFCGRFAMDMSMRCTAEVNQAHMNCRGDIEKIKSCVSYTLDAVVSCYMGSHNLCKKYSLVCKGGNNNWIERSAVLPPDFVM